MRSKEKESLIHGTLHEFVGRDSVLKDKYTTWWIKLLSKEGIKTIRQRKAKIRPEKHQAIPHRQHQ